MPLIIPRANPLAYPCGVAPGVGTNNRLASSCQLSCVAVSGGGVINAVTGLPATGASSTKMDSKIGPYVSWTSGNTIGITVPLISLPSVTMAAIIIWGGAGTANFFYAGDGARGWRLDITAGILRITANAIVGLSSGTTLTSNTPYFVAAAANSSASNFVVTNLTTGQIAATSAGGATPNGPLLNPAGIGGASGSSASTDIKIGCAAFAPVFVSLPELRQWAADPWSFWYPRRQVDLVGATAAAFKPYWANRNNDFAIGTGLQ